MSEDPVDALPPLRDVIARYELGARRALGQHFLLDYNLTDRIARAAGDLSIGSTIEIGPGPGGLTRSLLRAGAGAVFAIERDPRATAALADLVVASRGRLRVIDADALSVDLRDLCPAPRRIVANLPYNISTPLLIRWLRQADAFESMTLMFQKEVVDRMVAEPRTKAYGRLSVMCQHFATVRPLFDIGPSAFVPPPKVISTVVQLIPRQVADPVPFAALEAVAAAAFGQRRKMLRGSLKAAFADPLPVLAALDIPETARAEELPVATFVALARIRTSQNPTVYQGVVQENTTAPEADL